MKNSNLHNAKKEKNDEFYTQFMDIQNEVNAYIDRDKDVFRGKTILCPCDDPEWSNFTKFFAQNFNRFGIKKLISTSYCGKSLNESPTLFEMTGENYDEDKSKTHGKIFIVDNDINGDGKIDINDLHYEYLDGDGDFNSEEVSKLRDEADIIVTNPPFSLFRDFIKWIGDKKFLVIGNMNAITYKEIFPMIKENKMWLGSSISSGDRKFRVPNDYPMDAATCGIDEQGNKYINVKGVRWFTNLDHGKRYQVLDYMTMEDNRRFSKHKDIRESGYPKYDNYDAIEVSHSDAIPSDYDGVMGVPISFLDKYNPEKFEIVGFRKGNDGKDLSYGGYTPYFRILIRHKR